MSIRRQLQRRQMREEAKTPIIFVIPDEWKGRMDEIFPWLPSGGSEPMTVSEMNELKAQEALAQTKP